MAFTGCFASPAQHRSVVLEVVTFHVKSNIPNSQVESVAEKTNKFLVTQPGYLARTIARQAHGTGWIDIVRWHSLVQAQRAAKIALKNKAMLKFISLMTDYQLHHYFIKQTYRKLN